MVKEAVYTYSMGSLSVVGSSNDDGGDADG